MAMTSAEIEAAIAEGKAAVDSNDWSTIKKGIASSTKGADVRKHIYAESHAASLVIQEATEAMADYPQLVSDLTNINNTILSSNNSQLGILNFEFIHGAWFGDGSFSSGLKYRAASKDKVYVEHSTTFYIKPGFRVRAVVFVKSTGEFVSGGKWLTGSFSLSGVLDGSDRSYGINIARVSDIESETIPVQFLINQVYSVVPSQKHTYIYRVRRFLDRFYHNGESRTLYNQGICNYNGKYYICGNLKDTTQYITVWNTNTEHLNSYEFTNLYHANSIAINDSICYVATSNSVGIAILDVADDGITFNRYVASDLIESAYSVSIFDGIVYAIGTYASDNSLNAVIKINSDDTSELICTFSKPNSYVPQGFVVNNDYAYCLYNKSNCVYKIGLSDGARYCIWYLPDTDDTFAVGEMENLLVIDNAIYLYATPSFTSGVQSGEISVGQLFRTDIDSSIDPHEKTDYQGSLDDITYYVDGRDDATLSQNPTKIFTTIEEAAYASIWRHGATLMLRGVADGNCAFYNGTYAICKNSNYDEQSTIDTLYINNVRLLLSNITINNLIAVNSIVEHTGCTIVSIQNTSSKIETFNS